MRYEKIGARRHRAQFKQHDGTQGTDGFPTLTTDGDWDTVVTSWPCEMIAVTGGEVLRGKQVAAHTTHVLYGDYQGAVGVLPDMKCLVTVCATGEVVTRNVTAVMDRRGDGREMLIELREET